MPNLTIDKLAFGGSGFGRLDGKACFVPYTAPGDSVDITVTKKRSSYLEAAVSRVVSPADCRVASRCPVFGVCGGCNWQHIQYEEQCRQKEQIFAETMWRIGRIGNDVIEPMLAENEPYAYRQRVQLKLYKKDSRLFIGFYRHGSHYVVDLPEEGCAIARPEINAALCELRRIMSESPESDRIPQVDLSAGEDGSVTALFHYIGNDHASLRSFLASLHGSLDSISAVFMQPGRKDSALPVFGPEKLSYTLPSATANDLTMAYTVDSFSQVNFRQNRRMVDKVLSWVSSRSVNRVLDLFCGNGNFSLPLAGLADSVLGLESYGKSIELARYNALHNGITNTTFSCEDSSCGVASLAAKNIIFDLVLLDPPRTGADAVVREMHRLQPECLVYISCDPPTLGRDLALLQKTGFRVESVQPVDMFPQTYHLESVTLLKAI